MHPPGLRQESGSKRCIVGRKELEGILDSWRWGARRELKKKMYDGHGGTMGCWPASWEWRELWVGSESVSSKCKGWDKRDRKAQPAWAGSWVWNARACRWVLRLATWLFFLSKSCYLRSWLSCPLSSIASMTLDAIEDANTTTSTAMTLVQRGLMTLSYNPTMTRSMQYQGTTAVPCTASVRDERARSARKTAW